MAHAPAYGTPVVPSSPNSFATSNYKYNQIPKYYMQTSKVLNLST